MKDSPLWNRYKNYLYNDSESGFCLDISRMNFDNNFFSSMESKLKMAYERLESLEAGTIANPDEKRMVGHYWLRNSALAPSGEISALINSTLLSIKTFAESVHLGKIAPQNGGKFESLLVIGIGGSALGPQFVTQALGSHQDKMKIFFFDNTDPDGMARAVAQIQNLARCLTIVISKSGGTKETRNGQLIAKEAYRACGLNFARHFVAVTGEGSELDQTASSEKWLARFPMWDWVGGRTSEFSAVGLLPAALQGYDIDSMLAGAAYMDELTRCRDTLKNPAALLALSWYHGGKGKGLKDMVVLPYKDRLELFSKYLQQLVMESIGKERDLDGKVVNQGIAVYGNKGSTDQHAYVQQLRDGVNNFFAVFIEVQKDESCDPSSAIKFSPYSFDVEPGINCGDYLAGFYQGTRKALYENGRESVSITVRELNARSVGMLIALFERAVGFYASLVNVNAYHQPGVEAGKKAAAAVLELQSKVMQHLKSNKGAFSVEDLAKAVNAEDSAEIIFKILQRLVVNGRIKMASEESLFEARYSV